MPKRILPPPAPTPREPVPPLDRRPYVRKWRRKCVRCGAVFVRAFRDDHCDACLKKDPRLKWVDEDDGGRMVPPREWRRLG